MTPATLIKRTVALAFLALSLPLFAWEDHDNITYLALDAESYSTERVKAEELESFLEDEKEGIAETLGEIERAAEKTIENYPSLPPSLAFNPSATGNELKESFMRALRINPDVPFPLFLQVRQGKPHTPRPDLDVGDVDIFRGRLINPPFEALLPGELVTAAETVASASDEPDYGMDIGLYENNGTKVGTEYGFGVQPFGNPALSYGSQAPFHMAFASEDPIIKRAAPFTGKSLTEYRVMAYTTLAKYAFKSGHPYWGYRFSGWAVHYVQDMSQPYHASVMPGKDTLSMLLLNGLGSAEDIGKAVVLLSNRHLIIEDYVFRLMSEYRGDDGLSTIFQAIRGNGAKTSVWRDRFATDEAGWTAYNRGNELDALIVSSFPAQYVNDPSYDYGAPENAYSYDPLPPLRAESEKAKAIETLAAKILSDTGAYTRALVSWARNPDASMPPRAIPLDIRRPLLIIVPVGLIGLVVVLILAAIARKKSR